MADRFSHWRRWAPRSIAGRGVLLALLLLVSVGAPAYCVHAALKADQQRQDFAALEATLGVALTAYLDAAPKIEPTQQRALRDVAAAGERVRWAGVFGPDQEGVEFRRRTSLPRDEILAQIDFHADAPRTAPVIIDGHPAPRYRLFVLPRPDETLLAAIVDVDGLPASTAPLTLTMASAALALGLVLAFVGFQKLVVKPLIDIAKQASAAQHELALRDLDGDAPAELAGLLGSVESTVRELKQWRTHATYLQNAFDSELVKKTRSVRQALEQAERHAETDPLTKLRNRRVLERLLPDLINEHHAAGRELTAVVVDVNNFKRLNDTRGHQVGDELLGFVGDLLRSTTRRGADLAVRYGGDEFVLLLPDTDADEAVHLARRVGALFGQRARTMPATNPPVGLSFGVASLLAHQAETGENLLKLADAAMYFAKRHGLVAATLDDARQAQRQQPPRT